MATPIEATPGLAQLIFSTLERFADRPALGERATELTTTPDGRATLSLLPHFTTISYDELLDRVRAVATDWHRHPDRPLRASDRVVILGFTSIDYQVLDLAINYLGGVSVPLQISAPLQVLRPIVDETEPSILATSIERLDTAIELAKDAASVGRIIVFDYHPEVTEQREAFEAAAAKVAELDHPALLEALSTVHDRGADLEPAPQHATAADEDPLALLIYTSGSTGTPKGAMYPDSLVKSLWGGIWKSAGFGGDEPITINYMPMSHIAGRVLMIQTLLGGGTAFFTARSDNSTLFEDIALARPTNVLFVPRICDMVYQLFQSELDKGTPEAEIKRHLREDVLGGRINNAVFGAAPLSAEMIEFMESVLEQKLHNGFGSTEAGAILTDNMVRRPPVLDYKLIDVPELGYFGTDTPHPRGELLLRSSTLIPGYYKRPDLQSEVFDEDGWYRTGDIMAELGPDELIYVDRRKNVLKLSQGEFVAVSNLEAVFATSPLVRQIFVYGNSERAYLLAVVVPTQDALDQAHGNHDLVKSRLTESLQQVATRADLQSYEIPRDFLVETEPFSTVNGLLSDVNKLLRPRLKDKYGERLEQLYRELADGQQAVLRELRQHGAERPVLDTVGRAAAALLGATSADIDPGARFTDLGGDSLSALTFSQLLQEIFGLEVPVGVITSPANDLSAIAAFVEKTRTGDVRPTFASVHGAAATEITAAELALEKFIDEPTLAAATGLSTVDGPIRTVLITGGNGYLGRFLTLEWLERLAPVGGKVIVAVRGNSPEAARARLEGVLDSGDPRLLEHFTTLADGTLEVLAGDLGDPQLGQTDETWARLASEVDLIVHQAALVNHVLPYNQMFGPNVVGTAELVKLAITGRIKPVTYLSTVGVASDVGPQALDEAADIRRTSPVRPLSDGYANGYSNSKWAGEVLLREANDRFGVPVAVFRSDMILAHSHYRGQLNVPDMFTRLLLSVLATGLAPKSFYADGGRAHYDGLPADFTAEAIATLGSQVTEGYRTYNTVNPHTDGVSLDTFVDWLTGLGHEIHRIDDFAEWAERFETAIRGLPEQQRQHSLLPLLHAWKQPAPAHDGSDIPAPLFHTAVQEAKVGPDKDIPHLTVELIAKYADDLKSLGLL
ncbi:NAD-dependent epimerase/dehydratase family protein [Pseudonocardiaceae bacterium YIM PH 21723]|nr:NAD-dependent epimerase/dehydratase family protein [Pseudonocardiaceae bacterium YIM PH 21723]